MKDIIPPWKSAAKFVSIYHLQHHLHKLLTSLSGYGSCYLWRSKRLTGSRIVRIFSSLLEKNHTISNIFYSMGQITNDAASVFSQKLVDDLMTRPAWQLATPPKYIFLGVDPNGGGSSDLAIITCCFENNNLIFCGCETYPAKNHDQIEMLLLGHIRAIRGHPFLRNSWMICFFESNLG